MILVRPAVVGILTALLVGCTAHEQLRPTTAGSDGQAAAEICEARSDARDPDGRGCEDAVVTHYSYAYGEQQGDYHLAFVEFDDQGWFWDRKQMEVLMRLLGGQPGAATNEKGAEPAEDYLIFVFAHGWKHNAGACDSNVACFRRVLERYDILERASARLVGEERASRKPRQVVGVYVGWRGLSATVEPFKELSFWERKGTADRVGNGGVTELLVRLNDFRRFKNPRREANKTELVIFGHSFGGAVIHSALSQLLVQNAVRMEKDDKGEFQYDTAGSFGDLVVLVNPAFEGSAYDPLHAAATNRCYRDNQRPAMLVVTSRGDWATGTAFPVGRFFSTLLQSSRPTLQKESQKDTVLRTVGHLERYRTHELSYRASGGGPAGGADVAGRTEPESTKCGCPYLTITEDFADRFLSKEKMFLNFIEKEQKESTRKDEPEVSPEQNEENDPIPYYTGSPYLSAASGGGVVKYGDDIEVKTNPAYVPNYPYWVVMADENVVPDHNDIFSEPLLSFLRRFYFRHIKYRINFPPGLQCFKLDASDHLDSAEAVAGRTSRSTMITHRSRPIPILSGPPSSSPQSAATQGALR
jgi:hypothetical protein